ISTPRKRFARATARRAHKRIIFFFPMSNLGAEEKGLQIFAMIVTERKKSSVLYGTSRSDTIFFFLARSLHLQSLFRSGEWLIGKKKKEIFRRPPALFSRHPNKGFRQPTNPLPLLLQM